METLKVDRGLELNKKRLQGIETDICFRVEEECFPAHRLIVSLQSEYLKLLTAPNSPFIEKDQKEFKIQGLNAGPFSQVLQYMYTGSITIRSDNVFELLETVNFLQMKSDNDPIRGKLVSYMMKNLDSQSKISASLLVKVWNVSESYGETALNEAVKKFIDSHLEDLISDKLFEYISFHEIDEILSRPKLCIRTQKKICDSIIEWIIRKQNPDNEEDQELTNLLCSKLKSCFPSMSANYWSKILKQSLPRLEFTTNEEATTIEAKTCDDCFFFTMWSRDEMDIRGLNHFLEERKDEQIYLAWNLQDSCMQIKSLKDGKSFYQHYGPIGTKNGNLLFCNNWILYLGGNRTNGTGSKRHRDNIISDEVFTFETESRTWLRFTSRLPSSELYNFAAVFVSPHLYIIGGLNEGSFSSPSKKSPSVSKRIYRIHMDEWFSSTNCWQHVADLPSDRISISAAVLDAQTICIVSHDVVDILNISDWTWKTIPRSSNSSHHGREKPTVAIIGTQLYVINSKSDEVGANSMWIIDLSADEQHATWQPLLPSLELRFDLIQAFAHNGCLYILGHQTALQNFAVKFDPTSKKWTTLLEGFSGHFAPHAGVVLRQQIVKKAFFDGCHVSWQHFSKLHSSTYSSSVIKSLGLLH